MTTGMATREYTVSVVMAVLDAFRGELGFEGTAAVGELFNPCFDGTEHSLLNIAVRITKGRVVEDTQDIIDDLICIEAGVFESVEDTGDDELDHGRSNFTSGTIEDIGEVIF